MFLRVRFESALAADTAIDFDIRYHAFLGDCVPQNRHLPSVKEIQDPIVYMSLSDPEVMDSVAE
jgi:hypothetical protein